MYVKLLCNFLAMHQYQIVYGGNEVVLVHYLDSLFLLVVYQPSLVLRLHSLVNDRYFVVGKDWWFSYYA